MTDDVARVSDVLREAAAQFDRVTRRAQFLEEEKTGLVKDVAKAEAEAEIQKLMKSKALAKSYAEVAKAEVTILKDELNAARRREAEMATSQAGVLHALV